MAPDTGCARLRERCEELIKSLRLSAAYHQQMFSSALGQCLKSTVQLGKKQLPMSCTAVWLGYTGVDRITCNAGWPGQDIDLAAHAIGHLLLGHCGDLRDGGQFACAAGDLGADDRRLLSRVMHDAAGSVSRVFSDGEERAAAVFSRVLVAELGTRCPLPAYDGCACVVPITCLG